MKNAIFAEWAEQVFVSEPCHNGVRLVGNLYTGYQSTRGILDEYQENIDHISIK